MEGAQQTNPHVLLVGHAPAAEFLALVSPETLASHGGDGGAVMELWRTANAHVLSLAETEAGYADAIELGELPAELAPLAAGALADPVMLRDYGTARVSIAWVELDRLVVHQSHINLAYADELRAELGDDPSPARVFEFALPYAKRRDPPVAVERSGDAAWLFTSPSNDFRILDATLLDPSQVTGLDAVGVPSHIVALSVGYGSNYLSALSVEGRLVLYNGSHRAYALRAAGHTHAPCLVQPAGEDHPLAVQEALLTAARPPLFKDYFDENLRLIVNASALVRQVRVAFDLDVSDLPA